VETEGRGRAPIAHGQHTHAPDRPLGLFLDPLAPSHQHAPSLPAPLFRQGPAPSRGRRQGAPLGGEGGHVAGGRRRRARSSTERGRNGRRAPLRAFGPSAARSLSLSATISPFRRPPSKRVPPFAQADPAPPKSNERPRNPKPVPSARAPMRPAESQQPPPGLVETGGAPPRAPRPVPRPSPASHPPPNHAGVFLAAGLHPPSTLRQGSGLSTAPPLALASSNKTKHREARGWGAGV